MRESWRATNFPFPPSDLQFSDNYTRTALLLVTVVTFYHDYAGRPLVMHRRGRGCADTGTKSESKGENGGGDAGELFPRYKQELWSIYSSLCYASSSLSPLFFFPSHFVPLRSIERAVVTFEICWEEEKVLGSKGRMILNNV